jgi:POTRA domain-containing FtsQ-type protein
MQRPAGIRRTAGQARRARRIRRASAGLSSVRAGAALVVVVVAAVLYGVVASPAFGVDDVRIEGRRFTPETDVRGRLGVAAGANLFSLATEPLEAALAMLPTVARAEVTVALPDALVVRLTERQPILVWRVAARRYLIDVEGRLFAEFGAQGLPEAAGLPVVVDRRAVAVGLVVGRSLGPVDLDAARRLAALVPADVGSAAARLQVEVTDQNGFVVAAESVGWTAVFGIYTPSLRTTELIPGQVRLLRSLLADREQTIERIILASETDGAFTLKATPRPSATPEP